MKKEREDYKNMSNSIKTFKMKGKLKKLWKRVHSLSLPI